MSLAALAAWPLTAADPAPAQGPPPDAGGAALTVWTLTVDCGRGGSIGDALRQTAPELVVEVRGVCREDVVIDRDRVTLRGTTPFTDGIVSAGEADATLLVRSARQVRVENLLLAGARWDGLRVVDAHDGIEVVNVLLEGNGAWGASAVDATVAFQETAFTGNGLAPPGATGGGLIAARGSHVTCVDCLVEGSVPGGGGLGVVAYAHSTLRLRGGRFAGATAVLAQEHSSVQLEGGELEGTTWAFQANSQAGVRLRGTLFSGPFLALADSSVQLFGVTQTFNPTQNFVTDSSSLLVDDLPFAGAEPIVSSLAGLTLISDLARGRFLDGSTADELRCGLGGDAVCDGSQALPLASGCGLCP